MLGMRGSNVTETVGTNQQNDGDRAARRNRLLLVGAWAGFGLLVAALAFMSLRACSLSWLSWLIPHCKIAVTYDAGPDTLAQEVRALEKQLAEANACPAPEKPAEPPAPPPEPCPDTPPDEVVLSVDVSPSMGFCLDTPLSKERQIDELQRQANNASIFQRNYYLQQQANLLNSLQCPAPRRRIDVAKSALAELAASTRSEATIVLQSFSYCRAPDNHGRYSGSARGDMVGRINGLQLGESTALAQGIAGAAAALQGGRTADRPANIVIVSDGQDSCGGDPCAMARQVKRTHPHTKIHVITVGGDVAVGQCIAQATGGKVFEARDAAKLAAAIREASGENLPAHCRTPK